MSGNDKKNFKVGETLKQNLQKIMTVSKSDVCLITNTAHVSLVHTFFLAAERGDLDMVKLLVKKHPYLVKAYDKDGTALHRACYRKHVEMVKFLLENKADPNCTNPESLTPLHLASMTPDCEELNHEASTTDDSTNGGKH